MSKRKKPEIERYDDPFGDNYYVPSENDDPVGYPSGVVPAPVAIPAGLSDEDDAARYLQKQFDMVEFCTNCETFYVVDEQNNICPRCECYLRPVGTPPRRTKL